MEKLLRLGKPMQCVMGKIQSNRRSSMNHSIHRNCSSLANEVKESATHEEIIQENYYQQSFRYHHLNGSIETSMVSILDKLDIQQTLHVRNNKHQFQKFKQYRKLKTQLSQNNFYLNHLFDHYEYYESKSNYLKQQIDAIEDEIDKQVEQDPYSENLQEKVINIMEKIDFESIEQHMLKIDVSLKLKVLF